MSEGLEALKELRYRITNFNGKFNDYKKIMDTIEQELQALEIIKKKVDINFFFANYELTQEEYDLVREVLLR